MQNEKYNTFVTTVRSFYRNHGRHTLPWRKTRDPYAILVSEIMLQQTQVDRVIPKYQQFLERFPTVSALAEARLQEVLALWSGLGYNRRAQYLYRAAQRIIEAFNGRFPNTPEELETLPGVGHYTARAVATFAFHTRECFIETNIRTVFIHHFFKKNHAVSDTEIQKYIQVTLPKKDVHIWYAALMDYGSYLKQQGVTTHRKSTTYKKQSVFKGSERQRRGALLKTLVTKPSSKKVLVATYGVVIQKTLDALIAEGFVEEKKGIFFIR